MRRFRSEGKASYKPNLDIYSYKERWFRDYRAALPKIREELGKGYLLRTTLALTESQAKRLSQNLGETKFIPISEWNNEKVGFLLYKPKPVGEEKKEAEKKAPEQFTTKKRVEKSGTWRYFYRGSQQDYDNRVAFYVITRDDSTGERHVDIRPTRSVSKPAFQIDALHIKESDFKTHSEAEIEDFLKKNLEDDLAKEILRYIKKDLGI